MRRSIHFAVVATLCFAAYVLFNMGMDYVNFGYGLHPAIAFCAVPIVLIIALAVLFSAPLTDEQRRAANRDYIAMGGPCHDREFWDREKDFL